MIYRATLSPNPVPGRPYTAIPGKLTDVDVVRPFETKDEMRFLSVCSGIEAASVAWQPLGWRAVAFSEIEPFPCDVLAHHYPATPNWGDMTNFKEWPDVPIDLLCGGTPCQSFSVAGLRAGLADPRGNLALTYLAIAAKYRPRWLVWENVPGVFSSLSHDAPDPSPPPPPVDMERDGQEVESDDEYAAEELHAFNSFLAGLSECGYGWAYRVLDAQYFGVPQRRRRPFVVGYLGSWQRAAAVLFERHSLQGHPAPRRQAGKGPAGRPRASTSISSGQGWWDESDVGATIRAQDSVTKADTLVACIPTQAFGGIGVGTVLADVAPTLSARTRGGGGLGTDFDLDGGLVQAFGGNNTSGPIDVATARNASGTASGTASGRMDFESETFLTVHAFDAQTRNVLTPTMQVRRLTPEECEALQGFQRGYTAITRNGKPAADGPRYKALGNSWAVPCATWIGRRIAQVDSIKDGA